MLAAAAANSSGESTTAVSGIGSRVVWHSRASVPLSSTWSICSVVGIANLMSGSNRARLRGDQIRLLVERHQHILFAVDLVLADHFFERVEEAVRVLVRIRIEEVSALVYFEKLVGEKRYSSPAMISMPRRPRLRAAARQFQPRAKVRMAFMGFLTRDYVGFVAATNCARFLGVDQVRRVRALLIMRTLSKYLTTRSAENRAQGQGNVP